MKERVEAKLIELRESADVFSFLERNSEFLDDTPLCVALQRAFAKTCLSKAGLARLSGMSEVYIHQIFSGRRLPSRQKLIALCLTMETSVETAQHLLQMANYAPLRLTQREDVVVLFGLLRKLPVRDVEELLEELNERSK